MMKNIFMIFVFIFYFLKKGYPWVSIPTAGSPCDPLAWVWCFFFFFFLFKKKKKKLKLRENLEFYKSLRGIKVIIPILPFDLTSNPNGVGHCIKLEV
jgi:hypothetical protein